MSTLPQNFTERLILLQLSAFLTKEVLSHGSGRKSTRELLDYIVRMTQAYRPDAQGPKFLGKTPLDQLINDQLWDMLHFQHLLLDLKKELLVCEAEDYQFPALLGKKLPKELLDALKLFFDYEPPEEYCTAEYCSHRRATKTFHGPNGRIFRHNWKNSNA